MRKLIDQICRFGRLAPLLAVLIVAANAGANFAGAGPESMPLGSKPSIEQLPAREGGGASSEKGLLSNSLVRTTGSLAAVLALIFVLATLAKKLTSGKSGLGAALGVGGPSPAGVLEVLGRYPLGRGHTLILLKVDNRVLLLAQSSGGVRLRGSAGSLATLCEIGSPEEVASILLKTQDAEDQSMNARFRAMLSEADSKHDGVVDLTRGGKRAQGAETNWIEETFETKPTRSVTRSGKGGRA